jgi:hypothetical protein
LPSSLSPPLTAHRYTRILLSIDRRAGGPRSWVAGATIRLRQGLDSRSAPTRIRPERNSGGGRREGRGFAHPVDLPAGLRQGGRAGNEYGGPRGHRSPSWSPRTLARWCGRSPRVRASSTRSAGTAGVRLPPAAPRRLLCVGSADRPPGWRETLPMVRLSCHGPSSGRLPGWTLALADLRLGRSISRVRSRG